MKFIATKDGYLQLNYIRRLIVIDKRVVLQDDTGAINIIDETFDSDEDAQNYLDELIEELEKE